MMKRVRRVYDANGKIGSIVERGKDLEEFFELDGDKYYLIEWVEYEYVKESDLSYISKDRYTEC